MSYKVFFVEDEIVTREGIRDNVDWKANGFEFCGEAPDGEMALPMVQATRPDLLITDIKMPFMDGLQLSKIIRERMPWIKVIILSGHDEFEYARKAIKLGVTEYLLKPVTVQDLHNVLQKVAAQISDERKEQEDLRKLRDEVEANRAVLREKFLRKLVMGTVASSDAIEQSESLGMDLVARCYRVMVIKITLGDPAHTLDYRECDRVRQIVAGLVEKNPDVFLLEKDLEELVLVMKGNSPEYLLEEGELLQTQIERQIDRSKSKLTIACGMPKNRLADVYQSFIEALVTIKNNAVRSSTEPDSRIDKAELLKIDKSAVENYLKCGVKADFDPFFDTHIRPIGESACRSSLIRNYIFIDLMLATAKYVNELGGSIDQIIPDLDRIGADLAGMQTIEEIHAQTRDIVCGAIAFRDSQTTNQYASMIRQAKEYISQQYIEPDLSLNRVAACVNLSPCHFSAVFSQETGTTFKEYLTEIRIQRAKELLRTTALHSSEISDQIGYNDPHYFSYVFRKSTNCSPKEFRSQTQHEKPRVALTPNWQGLATQGA